VPRRSSEKLVTLAGTFAPDVLDREAMDVYMRLRPNVPRGREGWGKVGLLETDMIDALIDERARLSEGDAESADARREE